MKVSSLAVSAMVVASQVGQAMATKGLIMRDNGNCWYAKDMTKGSHIGETKCNMEDPTQIFDYVGHDKEIKYEGLCVDGWADDPQIKLWDCGNYDQQKWFFENWDTPGAGDYSTFRTKEETNKYCAFLRDGNRVDTNLCSEKGDKYKFVAKTSPKPKPSASGDPHFTTVSLLVFGGNWNFGGCDLVLVQNPGFANGLGMNIHIRTSIKTWWSFIESAVVQIGANTLQITGGGTASFSINGGANAIVEKGDASLGDFPVRFNRINDHQTKTRIDLGSFGKGDGISIETFKTFVRVNIADKTKKSFVGSNGMLGSYPDGKLIGRDGKTVYEDPNEFGQEWMVKPMDVILFHDVEELSSPVCAMPNEEAKKEGRRRLGENAITEEEAALACARVPEASRDACIFDVMATQDKEMAGSY